MAPLLQSFAHAHALEEWDRPDPSTLRDHPARALISNAPACECPVALYHTSPMEIETHPRCPPLPGLFFTPPAAREASTTSTISTPPQLHADHLNSLPLPPPDSVPVREHPIPEDSPLANHRDFVRSISAATQP